MTSSATVTLNPSGQKMPLVGFGAWKVGKDTCADTIYNAIKSGYRLIDGAQDYANEKECGQGVARAIKEGIIKREDIFITSKLWNTFHAKEHVEPMLKRSLADWGLEYFDLFLIHFPIAQKYVDPAVRYPPTYVNDIEKSIAYFQNTPISETWGALEKCVEAGLVKNIGISNFNAGLIRDLLTYAKIRPAVLQIEHHPYLTQPDLIKYVQAEGIAITAYSTFGPQSFIELNHPKAKSITLVLEHPTVLKIAEETKKTPAQVILRWVTQRNIAVIPKSNNQGRLVQNLDSTDFNLTEEQISAISALDIGLRFNNPADWPTPSPIF
ncbi:trifunctional aldehyde reductase/xylose reductase/glucose 1-dehydrogenase (NADP(+)) [Sugiyamaella lignohabitans]|uniref:Trifunctional aldehyde reductase/xylose reductase/glucose 1-dehydrogenase (NADP(+)) n=1 Tax=Sugiyamaella lignohabitans TaxID=796027 RepID=A0A167FNG1_9ASCO|nr:trifunctional aldehyde reductase/xylose reductase/glucose 1-dehydrogenase (NADP(+)) [Sugiyamaella lignohabitans]ANB15512.1 trifunctional aldehyde reductase/xylose reductase/glucose 1-dehydrogenase (NADP(+)) [Sugiyamaella lignohabitans]